MYEWNTERLETERQKTPARDGEGRRERASERKNERDGERGGRKRET